MTLEELKAYTSHSDYPWLDLAPEILALVEAAKLAGGDNAYMVSDALGAFNAKLESL